MEFRFPPLIILAEAPANFLNAYPTSGWSRPEAFVSLLLDYSNANVFYPCLLEFIANWWNQNIEVGIFKRGSESTFPFSSKFVEGNNQLSMNVNIRTLALPIMILPGIWPMERNTHITLVSKPTEEKGCWELCNFPTPSDFHFHGSWDKSNNH